MDDGWTRRGALRVIGGALAGSGLAAGTAGVGRAQESGESWTEFGYDAVNSGNASANTGPIRGVSETWRFETESGVAATPAVVDGTVFVGSWDGYVYALDAASGRERWRFGTMGGVLSSPAVANGTVYVGSEDYSVYALAADDGSERWRFATDESVRSSPTVVNGTVYVGSGDGYLYALAADDGSERWRFEAGEYINTSPAVVDGTVFFGSDAGAVHAVSAASGAEQWGFETGDSVSSSPAVVDGTVYVGSRDNRVYALAADDGTERWRYETRGPVMSSPAVDDSTSSRSVADVIVYVCSHGDGIYGLDAASGDRLRKSSTGDQARSSPVVVDDAVYFGSDDHTVYAQGLDRWENLWRFETGDGVWAGPAVANGTVYVGSMDGRVYALSAGSASEASAGVDIPLLSANYELALEDRWPTVGGVAGGVIGLTGGLWYWRRRRGIEPRRSDDERSALERIREDDYDEGDPDGISWPKEDVERLRSERDGGGRTVSPEPESDVTAPADSDPAAEHLNEGEGLEAEAIDLVEAGAYDRALSALDDARRAYGAALDAVGESDTVETAAVKERLDRLAENERETRRRQLVEELDALREAVADASDRDDRERAQEGLVGLADRLSDLADRAAEEGFGDLRDEIESLDDERADLLANVRDTGGPPESIPRAPDVTVDYGTLTDEETIGGGGNADVTKAILPTPTGDVTLAMKRPRMQGTLHTDAVERLLAEAETWDKLDDHDHVVGVVDYGAEPLPWIAMEYMDGGHLGARAGDLEFEQALWTALGITKGVRHAHRKGVAHLDLKPENVLFRSVEDAWDVPKVADWGLSKHLLEHSKSVEGLSPQYAAPEQFDEEYGAADDLTDVYQLGAVLYELFTGRPPFEGKPAKVMHRVLHESPTPPSDVADVPEALDDVLLTALATEKGDRYESVLYLRDALQAVGTG
jgi:outer membrane protein assembly factor BamB